MLAVQDVRLDPTSRQVWRGDREIRLSRKEFQLLLALYDRRGRARSRALLLREVWRRSGNETRTVDTHIVKLRQKLEDDPADPKYILSIYGEGYKFVG